jgi:hypothetical protein
MHKVGDEQRTPRLDNKYATAVEGQQTLVKTSARLELTNK